MVVTTNAREKNPTNIVRGKIYSDKERVICVTEYIRCSLKVI